MKTLSPLAISLVLSSVLAGHTATLEATLPIDSINKVLQMKIDKDVVNSVDGDWFFPLKDVFNPSTVNEELPEKQPELYSVPDCLCHLVTRAI